MRYVDARLDEFLRDETYRIYITQSLQLMPQNKYIVKSYTEMIDGFQNMDDRSGDDIAADIIKRAGLSFGDKK